MPPVLADAADANFVTHASWVPARLPGATVRDDGRLAVVDSGLPCDTFNFICRARLDGADASGRIREALDHFATSGRPFSWWHGPADTPADLGARLVAAGLAPAESELAMAADLADLVVPAPIAGLMVQRVQTSPDLRTYARLLSALWEPPDPWVVTFYDRGAAALLDPACPLRAYLALLDGEPVGTAEMTVAGGVAGLYNISTVPAFRRRGIGSWLTVQPLLDAQREGVATGVLQAAAAGVGIYERAGFRRYGGITEYKAARAPAA